MTHPPPGKYLSIAANQRVKREDERAASPDPLPSDEATRVASSGDEPTLTAESCIEPSDEAAEVRAEGDEEFDYIAGYDRMWRELRAAKDALVRVAAERDEAQAARTAEIVAWLRAAGPAAGGSSEARERIADFIVDRFAGGRVVTLPEVLAWLRAREDDIVVESRRITVAAEIAARFNPETEL